MENVRNSVFFFFYHLLSIFRNNVIIFFVWHIGITPKGEFEGAYKYFIGKQYGK